MDVDPNILLRGMKDAIAGGKAVLSDEEAKTVMTNLQANMRKEQAEKAQQAGDANKKQATRSWRPIKRKTAWSRCPAACNTRS